MWIAALGVFLVGTFAGAWVAGAFARAPSSPDGGHREVARLPTMAAAKPAWAKTSPEQDAYAARVGIPAWHETDLGEGQTLRFVLIPPGTFTMGSPASEEGRAPDEAEHVVTLTRPFFLSIGEVTNGQYRRFEAAHDSGKGFDDDVAPVVRVHHGDAMGYARWLTAHDADWSYRLPTEAEWEYACRAGTKTPFWFGAAITPEDANYDGRFDDWGPARGRYRERTTPAGTFAPNGWGLYDLHGNVREWCLDWYGAYPPDRASDPQGPTTGSARVLRGGAWDDFAASVRSASRWFFAPDYRARHYGFRVVRIVPRG
jgi:formylglycine-generating enzyme required for sulfatase activity